MSYDEQRISDQIDGGLYHKNQQEMTQETMTKEQIITDVLKKQNIVKYIPYFKAAMRDAMEEWESQQLSAERERAAKLVGALKSTILIFNKLGYPKTAEFVKQTIAEYDNTNND